MTNYYVSPSGSNSNNGLSTATPWLTLSHANANTTGGDTIYHLSGGLWEGQNYDFSHSINLSVYNGSVRWTVDYDGIDGGDYFPLIYLRADSSTIVSAEVRNNVNGTDHTVGSRGIVFEGDDFLGDDLYVHDIGGSGILRNFSGDTYEVQNSIFEHTDSIHTALGYGVGGGWGAAIAGAGTSGKIDGAHVHDCQVFEVGGEGINCFSFSTTLLATNITFEDNDLCGVWSVGLYADGTENEIMRRNVVLGTSNTNYHRFGTYVGAAFGVTCESTSSNNIDNVKIYLNLIAYCYNGYELSPGVGGQVTNLNISHNTAIDCDITNLVYSGGTGFGAGNIYRQNASILISGGTQHDNASDVPGASDFTNNGNYWSGGGEHANWNDATDFSDSAWNPFKTTGWQSIDSLDDVTVEDFRPTTEVTGTQYQNPDTSANWTDFEGEADFVEAGALAANATDPPQNPVDPPATPTTPVVYGKLFTPPRTAPLNSGRVVPGARLHFYRTGGNTEQAAYTDKACQIPHTNPVIADSAGVFQPIYLNPDSGYDYRIKLTDRSGNQLWLEDDVVAEIPEEAKLVQGSFQVLQTGYSANLTPTIYYRIFENGDGDGKVATLRSGTSTGTSNSTAMTLTNIPTALQPSAASFCPCIVTDDGNSLMGGAYISGSTITFYVDATLSATGFTNTGTKGLPSGWTITYQL